MKPLRRPLLLSSMLMLGFASGLPFALLGDPLRLWMLQRGFSIVQMGWLVSLSTPAALKFLWAPVLDRFVPPVLGRRRGWLLITQLALVAGIAVLAQFAQGASIAVVMYLGLAVAIGSATQDIAGDGYRTDVLPVPLQGLGASFWITAYRIALIVAGAGLPILVGRYHWPWRSVFLLASVLMALGPLATLIAPSEPASLSPPHPQSFRQAMVQPLLDLLMRGGGVPLLLFAFLFKIPEILAGDYSQAFLLNLHVPLARLAAVKNEAGIICSIAGGLLGGVMVTRLGLWRSLLICGLLGALSNAGYLLLLHYGPLYRLMLAVVCCESFCAGMVGTSLVALFTRECNHVYTATQFAIMTGIARLGEPLIGAPAAHIINRLGWQHFFIFSAVVGLPSLMLLPWLTRSDRSSDPMAEPAG